MRLKVVPERDIIWSAGIFDGEGTVYIKKTRRGKSEGHVLDMEVSMTHKPTIERLYNTYGIGSFRPCRRKNPGEGHRQAWKWSITSRQAVEVLNLMLPYISTKKEEVLVALEFAKFKEGNGGQALTDEVLTTRDLYYNKLKKLKKEEWTI